MSSCVRITQVADRLEVRTGSCEPFQIVLIVIMNTRGNRLVHGLRFQQSFFFLHLLRSLAVVESTDPDVSVLDLQEGIHSSRNAIIPVKMATTVLLLPLWEEVVV